MVISIYKHKTTPALRLTQACNGATTLTVYTCPTENIEKQFAVSAAWADFVY